MKKLAILSSFIFLSTFIISQTINKTLYFDNLNREYIIYIPTSYNNTVKVPLMFNFHGGAGTASDFLLTNDMRPIADTANFIAVYPQGAIDYNGADPGTTPTTSWLHKAPTTHNDVNFIAAIIDTLSSEYLIDEERVYACGYSEGGIFSYELGCRLNNKIAAFASVSGSMLTDFFRQDYGFGTCTPSHPTAVMLIPGTSDDNYHSLYDGLQPYYMSVNEITSYWSNYNNTDPNPVITNINDNYPNDGSTVERRQWLNGQNCVTVEELKVINGWHDWPGSFGNMDIKASEEIWKFVSQYNINGLIDCGVSNLIKNPDLNNKELIKIVDVLGRETPFKPNTPLLYIYNDGTVERKMIIKE